MIMQLGYLLGSFESYVPKHTKVFVMEQPVFFYNNSQVGAGLKLRVCNRK